MSMSREVQTTGEGLRVSLRCPRCRLVGWVEWQNLGHGLKCSHCQCRFVLGRGGKILTPDSLPHVAYHCPRCKQRGRIPAMLASHGAQCSACQLPLVWGIDNQLHDRQAAARLRQTKIDDVIPGHATHPLPGGRGGELLAARPIVVRRLGRTCRIVAATCVVLLCSVAVIYLHESRQANPVSAACRFTRLCLCDRALAAQYFVEQESDVQLAEYERWWVRWFPSLQDRVRPSQDRVAIKAIIAQRSDSHYVMELTMTSAYLGTRTHKQVWYSDRGVWKFDAQKSLAVGI